ncbi:hypothetical protein FA95DRAFT_1602034 [Auriscalpium vulgare]|uniref:Uncharacterized protein n=1 Tax=Auriscalpium vulgare TaxID=40419 RepID=A0ACB8S7L0_9AGAM|nr:hypothetical protein FA95DRAFT_1602034 [Auriscalpium vulgare]
MSTPCNVNNNIPLCGHHKRRSHARSTGRHLTSEAPHHRSQTLAANSAPSPPSTRPHSHVLTTIRASSTIVSGPRVVGVGHSASLQIARTVPLRNPSATSYTPRHPSIPAGHLLKKCRSAVTAGTVVESPPPHRSQSVLKLEHIKSAALLQQRLAKPMLRGLGKPSENLSKHPGPAEVCPPTNEGDGLEDGEGSGG